ncbi:MAG: hypothetical protein IJS72_02550 [Oscillospiraceae bacterium]|nr:hypothetical protein [Oscillospiraceae bacterium]
MDKKTRNIIIIVAAVLAVAAAVVAVIVFREDIKRFFTKLVEKVKPKKKYTVEECEDFADI